MIPLNGLKHVQLNLDYKTMLEIKTIADLQKLIQDEIEESTVLEYKSSFAIQNKKWHSCISPWQYNHVIQRS